jgi:glyoxylase-like metal-dependent hydrolase (beta-lactamase superfamily II)
VDKGDALLPLITPWARHAFIPRGKPRGILQKVYQYFGVYIMTRSNDTKYEIYALKYAGPFKSSGALILWMMEWEKTFERHYFFWCIKGEGGPIILDCGVSPVLAEQKALNGYISPVVVLQRAGVEASQVRKVILSHLHWDHCSGVKLFPNATFYVQEKEFSFWTKDPIAKKPVFQMDYDHSAITYLSQMQGSGQLVLVEGDKEILPGIELLLAPGHTPGLQAVAVKTGSGTAVLGSDCAHFFRNYAEEWPSIFIVDLVAWMKTYDKLKAKASSAGLLFPGHDPQMLQNYPRVAEDVTKLA